MKTLYDKNGKQTNLLEKGDIYAQTYTLDGIVIPANSNLTIRFKDTIVDGYARNMYMVGFQNDTNGANSSYINAYLIQGINNDTLVFVKNTANAEARIIASLRVLYIKSS